MKNMPTKVKIAVIKQSIRSELGHRRIPTYKYGVEKSKPLRDPV